MFLIKLKMIGNCIISDLDHFQIYCGNDKIIDLEEWFPMEKIQKSLRYPDGDLCSLLDTNVIEKVRSDSIEWKKQARDVARMVVKKQTKTNKDTIKEIIDNLQKTEVKACQEKLENEFFDNLSILDKIINNELFHNNVRKKAKELMNENLNEQIDSKFILI